MDRQCLASNGQVRFIVSQIGKVAHSKKKKKKRKVNRILLTDITTCGLG